MIHKASSYTRFLMMIHVTRARMPKYHSMAGMIPPLTLLEARMQLMIHAATARRFLALTAALAIGACADDGSLTSPDRKLLANNGSPTTPPDTTAGSPSGEWHLQTIRGVLHGVVSSGGLASGDTSSMSTPIIAGAKIEIHKFSLDASATTTSGDSATVHLQDLGVAATVTSDAAGKFEYVLSDPIVVKSGQPSPRITYRLAVTPPAGSPFAARSDIQVFFMEQFPAGTPDLNYYLFPPRP